MQSTQEKHSSESKTPSAKTDFYTYVNKSWLEDPANQIPGDYSRWGGFIKLHDNGLNNQIQMVKDLRDKKDKNEEEVKISAIWEASASRFESWRNGTADYDPIIRELEILDAYLAPGQPIENEEDLLNRVADYLHYCQVNGITNVFDFDKGSDLTNSNNVVLDISTCGLSLPGREYYTESNFDEKRKLFKQHLENIQKIIGSVSSTVGENFVQNVLDFEHQFAGYKMKKEQARRYDEYYTNTTLVGLYQNINDLKSVGDKQSNYEEADKDFKLSESQINSASKFSKSFMNCLTLEKQ